MKKEIKKIRLRYRKWKRTRIRWYNFWDFEAEPGDLMISDFGDGKLYRLEERRFGGMRALGELYPREIKPPIEGLKAVWEGDDIYWIDEETFYEKRKL